VKDFNINLYTLLNTLPVFFFS